MADVQGEGRQGAADRGWGLAHALPVEPAQVEIAVVEADVLARATLSSFVDDLGYPVAAHPNLEDLKVALASGRTTPHVLVTEFSPRDAGATAALHGLHQARPWVLVIATIAGHVRLPAAHA